MYFYVDESGQTGLELFDDNQPFLYYGVLSSEFNLDELSLPHVERLRNNLGVERLHAAELGNGRLVTIVDDLVALKEQYKLSFDFYRVTKKDHAAICFFDQVFDQGNNPAVPWNAYWTPLRYVLVSKVSFLFDEALLKKSWKARIAINKKFAEKELVEVCQELLSRVNLLPDERSIEIITDALNWAIKNPSKIYYHASSKEDKLQISPNLIGFQSVMHGIATRLENTKSKATKVVVDRQSEFNKAQEWIADLYRNAKKLDEPMGFGPGMPTMDLRHMPSVQIECTPGTDSSGLELVDIYIWIFKRQMEGKPLATELSPLIHGQASGMFNEVSIQALMERWEKWFQELPIPTPKQIKKGKDLLRIDEERRAKYVKSAN
ncbi:hypothetical protein CWC16_02430 [Pseudoalteromonas sp. S3776]|uniref:DUF3800 domain-containing protein n=1 Tax=Pseudoalteromonas sp. S3776 TaxID=579544 RepID=UPI001109884B|nr:DUF3800 domain-containing protein [Pseudoalteromonas sp. S3776]TMO82004.1 hypothetical protein CWC16_02430 [Pseudoalteromonas sp. S3776]